ncbi:MAG: hypothetical protein QG575_1831, partial [Euryarchaeota archaeon]|nr:hypothetical protein [Euryarchaeota archaeon]
MRMLSFRWKRRIFSGKGDFNMKDRVKFPLESGGFVLKADTGVIIAREGTKANFKINLK